MEHPAPHVESPWRTTLRNRIIQASSLLEILLSGLVLIGLLLSAVPLIKWMPGLRLLAVDGVEPSNDTIASEKYPLCNEFYAVLHADAAADSPERRLYDWLDTDAGQDCIQKSGYVAVGPQTTVTIVRSEERR